MKEKLHKLTDCYPPIDYGTLKVDVQIQLRDSLVFYSNMMTVPVQGLCDTGE